MTKEEALNVLNYLASCEDVNTYHKETIEIAIEALEQEKIGKWIIHPEGIYACWICDKCLSKAPHYCRTNYCPNCGAKMSSELTNDIFGKGEAK